MALGPAEMKHLRVVPNERDPVARVDRRRTEEAPSDPHLPQVFLQAVITLGEA